MSQTLTAAGNQANGRLVGKKVDEQQDNPIDHWLSLLSAKFSGWFKSHGFTPNKLTTISFLLELCAIALLFTRFYILSGVLFFAGYFFDVFDGFFARRYNMETQFGDFYDHATDIMANFFFLVVIFFMPMSKNKKIFLFVVIGILFITSMISLGCIQNIYQQENGGQIGNELFLDCFRCLCSGSGSYVQERIKYLGVGTYYLAVSLIMSFIRVV